MSRLIPGWTRTAGLVLLAAALALMAVSTGALVQYRWLPIAIPLVVLLTFGAGLALDPFVALVCGIGGAALIVWMRQVAGAWSGAEFLPAALQVAFVIATGAVAGMAGRHLRAHAPRGEVLTEDEELYPVYGSLGLLRPDLGETRLAEEVDRARGYTRPLSILRLSTRLDTDKPVTEAQAEAIRRAVARMVEGLLRVTDVPFAYEEDCIVAILPETDQAGARWLSIRVGDAVAEATFVVRPAGTRLCISDYACVRLGTATFPRDGETAHDLLEAAAECMEDYRSLRRARPHHVPRLPEENVAGAPERRVPVAPGPAQRARRPA